MRRTVAAGAALPLSALVARTGRRQRAGGGTTTLLFDTREKALESATGSISGTIRNCAGGLTPWGTRLTCEETNDFTGMPHGYIVEVPADGLGGTSARGRRASRTTWPHLRREQRPAKEYGMLVIPGAEVTQNWLSGRKHSHTIARAARERRRRAHALPQRELDRLIKFTSHQVEVESKLRSARFKKYGILLLCGRIGFACGKGPPKAI